MVFVFEYILINCILCLFYFTNLNESKIISDVSATKSLKIFNHTKLALLKVAVKNEDYTYGNLSGYELYDEPCSARKDSLKSSNVRFFDAKLFTYKGENSNMKFGVEITFKIASNEDSTNNGYQLRLTDEKHKFSCIQILRSKNTREKELKNSGVHHDRKIRKFKLIILDLSVVDEANIDYLLNFGKFSINTLIEDRQYGSEYTNWISLGVPNQKRDTEVKSYALNESNCLEALVFNTCIDLYKNTHNEHFLVIIQPILNYIDEYYHQFGLNKKFYEPIISYQSEAVNNYVFKIVDNISLGYTFYYTSFFQKPSSNNKCATKDNTKSDNYCICNDECIECYTERHSELYVITVNIRTSVFSSECYGPIFNFSQVTFVSDIEQLFSVDIENSFDDEDFDVEMNKRSCSGSLKYICLSQLFENVNYFKIIFVTLIILVILILASICLCSTIREKSKVRREENDAYKAQLLSS